MSATKFVQIDQLLEAAELLVSPSSCPFVAILVYMTQHVFSSLNYLRFLVLDFVVGIEGAP
jgi:hypothetical protein